MIQSKGDIGRAMADFILKRQDEIQQQIDDGNDLSVSARKITQKSVSEHVKQICIPKRPRFPCHI